MENGNQSQGRLLKYGLCNGTMAKLIIIFASAEGPKEQLYALELKTDVAYAPVQ